MHACTHSPIRRYNELENAEVVIDVFKSMKKTRAQQVELLAAEGDPDNDRSIALQVAQSLKHRLRSQRLVAPTRIYKTRQTLLPLMLHLN